MKSGSEVSVEAGVVDAGLLVRGAVVAGMGDDDNVPVDWVPAGDGVSTLGELADSEDCATDDGGVEAGKGV